MGAQVISTSERFKFNHVYDFYIGKDALFGHIVINKDMKFTIPNFFKNGFTKEYLEGYLEGVEHMSKDVFEEKMWAIINATTLNELSELRSGFSE